MHTEPSNLHGDEGEGGTHRMSDSVQPAWFRAGSTTTSAEVAARFADLHPALTAQAAIPEANRCLFCFDAPCMTACPTHIDVPRFIKKIASGNLAGSARTILEANVLGASCSRACPVEVLCEGACVLNRYNQQPIEIGRLQRFAMDAFYASGAPYPFEPAAETGRSVALIGAGPASLACAAELRRKGIRALLYDARPLPGGLNTYGIAEYKLPLAESLREIEMLTQLGVEFHFNTTIDAGQLAALERDHDAVFLGIGLGAIHRLGLSNEELPGVTDALDFIAGYKAGSGGCAARRVAVIGAGNTAIDASIAAVRLGAAEVTMVYRRGEAQMSAFPFEYEHARREGVRFLWNLQPVGIAGTSHVEAVELAPYDNPGQNVVLETDLLILAIGQATHAHFLDGIQLDRGRIVIDRATGETSKPKFFAGGDCTNGGREVVDAVADGKRAGLGIVAWLGVADEAAHA
jgi:dihydropyrimidine dehydrogenase (NAD+) subunit PreT